MHLTRERISCMPWKSAAPLDSGADFSAPRQRAFSGQFGYGANLAACLSTVKLR